MATVLVLQQLTDEELVVFSPVVEINSNNQVKRCVPFELNALPDSQCLIDFRFEKKQILRLRAALGIPEFFKCRNGTCVSGVETLCIVLRRLAYPNR